MDKEKGQVKVYETSIDVDDPSSESMELVSKKDYDQLKADFERVVKFYGDSDKMHTLAYEACENKLGYIPDEEDFDYVEGKRNKYLGKLARELAAKHGIEV